MVLHRRTVDEPVERSYCAPRCRAGAASLGVGVVTGAVLPQPGGELFLTDSGLETDLIFHGGWDLPHFAAFPLLDDPRGRAALREYFAAHVRVAEQAGRPVVLETPTWRASADWGDLLGRDAAELDRLNRDAVRLVQQVRDEHPSARVLVSGCIGPRGDGYRAGAMTAEQAQQYHAPQVRSLAAAGADLVTGMTLSTADEAVGLVLAASAAGVPVVVSFTVEVDGRLPDGSALAEAVQAVDAATGAAAAYFMVNCAHPLHVWPALGEQVGDRLVGLRANASRRSHAELDEAEVLDEGDPVELARELLELRGAHPSLAVLGGCCGTDVRHIRALAEAAAG